MSVAIVTIRSQTDAVSSLHSLRHGDAVHGHPRLKPNTESLHPAINCWTRGPRELHARSEELYRPTR